MTKWRPWPNSLVQQSKKFEARIVVRCLSGLERVDFDGDFDDGLCGLRVEIKWKGARANGFRSFRKKRVKRDLTRGVKLSQNGVVLWDEEFKSVCGFCDSKDKGVEDGLLQPWEVAFVVFNDSQKHSKKKVPLAAPAVLNLADFASVEDFEINVPLSLIRGGFKPSPSLCISLSVMELKTIGELAEEVQRPTIFAPLSPCFGGPPPAKTDEGSSTLKSSLRKVKSLSDYVSSKRSKKASREEASSSDSKFSTGSEGSEHNYPFDTDSFDDTDEGESEESKEMTDVQKSCDYGTLVHANLAGGALDLRVNCGEDDLVYYSNKRSDGERSYVQDFGSEVPEQVMKQSPRFGILSWRKRKLSFKSPRVKGEPLLKKDYGDEGGDDIDFDRRQLSSDESIMQSGEATDGSGFFVSEFGEDNFAVGCWEDKDVLSRDGTLKLKAQVFFASIDQRSERAAGESACTALVAVIADWLHSNRGEMPIKSDLDTLIREGSLQWRKLCDNDTYRERFPDKHFDLDTVLEAGVRPLSVVPERSFVGFFRPEGLEEEHFGFLDGAMSFDDMWDEVGQVPLSEPSVYVVSWNDHFFLLRVDLDAYYIIDTLGERLYEGCNQAYVLKFDRDTIIERVKPKVDEASLSSSSSSSSNEKSGSTLEKALSSSKEKSGVTVDKQGSEDVSLGESRNGKEWEGEEDMMVCMGKESCKEYIKSFLAAIPIRELQVDMKKGLRASTPLHHILQIEFNYTVQRLPTPAESTAPAITVYEPVSPVTTDEIVMADELALVADGKLANDELTFVDNDKLTPVVGELPVPMLALAAA